MQNTLPLIAVVLVTTWASSYGLGYDSLDSLTDSLFRDVVGRLDYVEPSRSVSPFATRRDFALLNPSLRDREYLEHSSLFGHQSMQGGAGEGFQRLKPDGSMKNIQVVKTDSLPAYCNPPNPCPLGYTAEDGCVEEFENTAAFSREYQAAQECMCDSEHMFDCPGQSRDSEIDALARSFANEGMDDRTLDRIMDRIDSAVPPRDHKVVAKKFFKHKRSETPNENAFLESFFEQGSEDGEQYMDPYLDQEEPMVNPYLTGERLPVVAKKAPSIK